ncbi:MAG TPA: AAA family ATPase, partial [Nocardioides sp.]|nr:AAA family ATPase [Nocardioides sp.]
ELPPGAHRDLNEALHDLHHRAGWPSLRALAKSAGCSHTTVSAVFSAPRLPSWGVLELLVEAMDGDVDEFRRLWLGASTSGSERAPQPRIAGRRAELAAVRRHLEGSTGLLLVTGEAGIGKTKLVTIAADEVGSFVGIGHGLPLSTEVPLLPVVDCLRSVHDGDATWLKSALASCPPYVTTSLASLLPEVAGESGSSGPSGRADDRHLLFGAVGTVLRALVALRPVTLLFEDLHWADPTTLDLLEHLLGRGSPIPVLGTWRTEDETVPEPSTQWLTRVRRMPSVTVLALGPLTRDQTAKQLALLGAGPERLDTIHARSQGQPLFTEQLAAHAEGAPGLPALLADLLDQRLDNLGEPAWAVLRTLGVAERPLTPDLLAAGSGLSVAQLLPELRELQRRRLLRRVEDDGAELHHPLLADAVQRRLVAGEASAVHRALAETLGRQPQVEAAEVATHWQRAADPAQELGWRIDAARAASARFDQAQAAEHWLRALEIWPATNTPTGAPALTRAEAYIRAMDALRASFQRDRAAAMSDAAPDALGTVPDEIRADLLFRAAEYTAQRAGSEDALVLIDQALALYERVPVRDGMVRALNLKEAMLRRLGRYAEANSVSRAAIDAADALGDPILLRDCLMSHGWLCGIDGSLGEALSLIEGAASRAGTVDDPLGDLRQAEYTTDLMLQCGEDPESIARVGRAGLDLAARHGIDNLVVMNLTGNTAGACLRAGDVAGAASVIGDLPADEPDTGHYWLYVLRAVVEATRGEIGTAHDWMERVWVERTGQLATDLEFLTCAASVDCWLPAPQPVLDRLLAALDVLAGTTPVREVAAGLVASARCAADLVRVDPAASSKRDDVAVLQRVADRSRFHHDGRDDLNLAVHRAAFALELARHGNDDHVEGWAGAAALWEQLGRPHDAAYCRWRAGQVALAAGQGTVARRLLRRAVADARQHAPLSEAIAATAAHAQTDEARSR